MCLGIKKLRLRKRTCSTSTRLGSRLSLDTETIKSASRALERIDNIESGHSLPLGMLGVCDRVANDLKGVVRTRPDDQGVA
jgi:hypothetical protein